MERLLIVVNKYGLLIILLLSLTVFFKTCSTNQRILDAKAISLKEHARLDSLIIASHAGSPTVNDMLMLNNDLLKEYNVLIFAIVNNKISSAELTDRLKLIESNLIKIKNNNDKLKSKTDL